MFALNSELTRVMPGDLARRLVHTRFDIEAGKRQCEWQCEGQPERSGNTVRANLVDASSGLRARVTMQFETAYNAAVTQVSLENATDKPSPEIGGIAPLVIAFSGPKGARLRTVGGGTRPGFYPPQAFEVRMTHVIDEGDPLVIGSSPNGRSSEDVLPFLMVETDGCGMVMGAEWSGLWQHKAAYNNTLELRMEIPVSGIVLDPGETLHLPAVHAVFFQGDLADGGNALRRYIYERVMPPLDGAPVVPPLLYNHWFFIRGEFDEALLKTQADHAAALGAEYFVLDATWYDGVTIPNRFEMGLGNLRRVDPAKFPAGLEPFAAYVRDRGMKFGLWFEIERAYEASDLAREHPDWLLVNAEWQREIGQATPLLNLALKEAQEYVIDLVGGWIARLDLDWMKLDSNVGPAPYWRHADPTGKLMFQNVQGLYRVLDTLIARHPACLMECCAGGGRRIDLGMLKRAHVAWLSDQCSHPHLCRFMQTGANHLLPGNACFSGLALRPGDESNHLGDLEFLSRMCGSFFFSGDVARWPAPFAARAAEMGKLYTSYRHLLVQNFYPLTPHPKSPADWDIVEFASYDGDEAAVLAFNVNGPATASVPLRGIQPGAAYEVSDPLAETPSATATGEALMRDGIAFRLPPDRAALRFIRKR